MGHGAHWYREVDLVTAAGLRTWSLNLLLETMMIVFPKENPSQRLSHPLGSFSFPSEQGEEVK